MGNFLIDNSYLEFLKGLKGKISQAQTKAIIAVNQQMIFLYWDIGKEIFS